MEVNAPSVVNAGESFEVAVTLDKGEVSGFSRYLQQLPYGLSAVPSENANADFSFKDQKIRFIWLRLPEDNESVTFSYVINVDERLKGEFNLEGLFSFIENNERRSVSSQSPMITILPSPNLSPDQIVDISEFENAVIHDLTPKTKEKVMCYRQKPAISETNDGLIINIIVDKNDQEKFAKIEETIPLGYEVLALEKKGAIFSYKDNMVKFLWRELPADDYFSVSYKLVPQQQQPDPGIKINGQFSYIEDDIKTVTLDIVQEEFEITENTPEGIGRLFDQLHSGTYGMTAIQTIEQIDSTGQDEQKRPSLLTDQQDVKEKVEKSKTQITQKTSSTKRRTSRSDILTPEKGVYYRIQVAAGHRPVNIRRYFKKFNLEKSVKKEMHQGWHKYSVGSFREYREARDYRNYIWRTTLIDDAFVSAYNDGARITVQEALMIANQRWYK